MDPVQEACDELQVWTSGQCRDCGAWVVARGDVRFCSEACQARVADEIAAAAARRLEVFNRDDWVCWLCLYEVDPTEPRDHPLAPSLDHVIPRSMGGPDDVSNLRTAHRACNTFRGCDDPAVVEVFRLELAEAQVRWYRKRGIPFDPQVQVESSPG